ncbi:hypothetical protein GUITHDRAFT_81602 [Guillardia theta CCMP2712]|uniref:RNA helicase n=1 Tax=Guillardia theta (strain CCMP2712) TaxID=905079 RepID=L1IBM1_GUITC|nr:hypothetical protein GUITHDRAFT_81602 [Guillardia theta CCMP2712]EKX33294.1 hypothetical protein GUITHDRAFT_81602 [Guillardia theta CCMP2712]|eukprot:XP_005820274.1 hypothetical protein GUITHDRAFT_81602 [Guillardia theta CCMP2712]
MEQKSKSKKKKDGVKEGSDGDEEDEEEEEEVVMEEEKLANFQFDDDDALNELAPKGWDVSDMVKEEDDLQEETQTEASKKQEEEEKERLAFQRRMEKEREYFDDAPVQSAETSSFQELHLSRPLLKAVSSLGFIKPTVIQSMVIPVALQGKDVCASSRTGSGKTAAFALPILERLLYRPRRVAATRVLVLTPTRELAVQAHAMMEKLAAFTDIRCYIVIGGVKNQLQETELRKKPDVVVATPGRMIDHLRNAPGIGFEALEILVLDEADRLLEMGFTEEVQELVKMCPQQRQTMLFSATMTHDVDKLAAFSLRRPVRVTADGSIRTDETQGTLNKVAVPSSLLQEFVRIRKEHEKDREAILLCLCTRTFHKRTIVFCREKRRAHRLRIIFGLLGLRVEELHGNLTQAQRLEALENFKEEKSDFLLATDLAGRGLDIKGVDVVVNLEVPRNLAEYVHRVGRTARAGRKGRAVTLADDSQRTKSMLKEVVRSAPDVVKRRVVPPDAIAAMRSRIEELEADVAAVMEEEAVERQMRIADMEGEKARNLVEHEEDILARPKKTWFQSREEKLQARESNPSSGRSQDRRERGKRGREEQEEGEDGDPPQISKKKVIGNSKADKYAGMNRRKRRRLQMQEDDELEKAGAKFFGKEEGPREKNKALSQRAAKSAYRHGRLDPKKMR